MAHWVVLFYNFDMSKFVEVDGDHSTGHSRADNNFNRLGSFDFWA